MKILLLTVVILILNVAVSIAPSFAQTDPRYIALGGGVKGALYKPDTGPAPHVGIVVSHRTLNYLSNTACTQLSARGFMVLCMNPTSEGSEARVNWENMPLDVGRAVNFLKSQPGITKVILWSHSGGGPLMSFYQAVAENGPSYCQRPEKLVQCGDNLAGLAPADGIILADAHPGNTVNRLREMHPGVFREDRPDLVRAGLDPFNPKFGFNPNGPSTYSEEFKEKYHKAQADRMNRLIDDALERLRLMEQSKYRYPDDDVFPVSRVGAGFGGGGGETGLFHFDLSILCCTVNPQKLLKNDGTIVTQIIRSVRVAEPENEEESKTFEDGTLLVTIRSFLGANAIRATHSIDYNQIHWCTSNNSTPCAIENISVPILIAGMGGHYFIRDAEFFYERAKSVDKDLIIIEGATHGFAPCTACEQVTGQSYSNARQNFFDYVRDWINARF
jgi:hypothetical protein